MTPSSRTEVVAKQQVVLALLDMIQADELENKIAALSKEFHRLRNDAEGSLEVAKQLCYGGKAWIEEFITDICAEKRLKKDEWVERLHRLAETKR